MGARWHITSRTVAGFLLMAGLLAAVNFAMVLYINRLQTITVTILDHNVSSLLAAVRMEEAIQAQRRRTANFLLTGDEEAVTQLLKDRDKFTSVRQHAQAAARTSEERVILVRIDALYEGVLQAQDEAISSYRQGRLAMARDMLVGASREQTEALLEACEAFSRINERQIEAARGQMLGDNVRARRTIYGIAVMGVVLGGLLGVVIARSVVRPIAELVLKVRSTGGDIVERVELSEGRALESLGQGVESLMQKVKSVSADLARSEQMLIQAEKLSVAGQFAAGIAHEIRNPLAAIKTMVFAMSSDLPPEDARRVDFEVMREELDQMERSIQRLLDFARPPEPAFASVRLHQAATNAVNLLTPKAQSQGVQVEARIDRDIVIVADQRQIEQVFVNLMLNALQAMPEGGKVRIEAKVTSYGSRVTGHTSEATDQKAMGPATRDLRLGEGGDGRWVEVAVSDTGCGIPEALVGQIFEPFVTARASGTGLGLAIVRKIVEQHGGWIVAENRTDGGAVFKIALPIGASEGLSDVATGRASADGHGGGPGHEPT